LNKKNTLGKDPYQIIGPYPIKTFERKFPNPKKFKTPIMGLNQEKE